MDNIWAEQRRLEALKLNYKVLETMCTAEAQVLHAKNLTSLFHRCMLACSAELVLATHKTVTMLFLAVLERIGITAFNLSKVIQSFIRHEESLPRELRRHLNSLEERLLESMVWEKGSSMYNSLTVARPALSAEINLGFTDILFQDSQDSWEEFTSILYPIEAPHAPSTSTVPPTDSPTRQHYENLPCPTRSNPGGGGEPCAETGINICFCKMDALISHSSKSYYACVGESTHAYSPFKDLTDINHRLNSNRRVRGALNFDDVDVDVGLVSDSMVVNSLYLQNGSAAASTCAVLKPEQLDP
ncbi:retinoblastoma-related protein 1 [Citrus sinensis]|nr:retinoblastoma-related protein 1 [Citrus sinensis]